MASINIPEGYQRVMPYLILNNAAGFADFMKKVFGAEDKMKMMRDEQYVMHAELRIGDSTIMYADSTDQWKSQNAGLFIYVENADESYRKALDAGAISVMEPRDQDYGRSGGVEDAWGNTWWITSPRP